MLKRITGRFFCLLAAFLVLNGLVVSSLYPVKIEKKNSRKHIQITQKDDSSSLLMNENWEEEEEEEKDEFEFDFHLDTKNHSVSSCPPFLIFTLSILAPEKETKINFSFLSEKHKDDSTPKWLETRQILI